MTTEEAIATLERKGYIVSKYDNMSFGKLVESCPIVYDIYNPDHTHVYGSNSTAPEQLPVWAESLRDLTAIKTPREITYRTAAEEADRRRKEREYDEINNDGGEGYNPYRA